MSRPEAEHDHDDHDHEHDDEVVDEVDVDEPMTRLDAETDERRRRSPTTGHRADDEPEDKTEGSK